MTLEGLEAQGPGSIGVLAIPVAHRHDEADMRNAVVVLLDPEDLSDLHQIAGADARKGRADHDLLGTRQLGFRWQ